MDMDKSCDAGSGGERKVAGGKAAVIAFTRAGYRMGGRIAESLREEGFQPQLAGMGRWTAGEGAKATASLEEWTSQRFADSSLLVFVGACGIAVRAVAPWLKDKWRDPAVLAADEQGRYVIALLSGHGGGGNEAARRLAARLGAQAVITTATDGNGVFAVDEFARKNRLRLSDRKLAGEISAALLEGEPVGIGCEPAWRPQGELPGGLRWYEKGEKNLPVFGIWIGSAGETKGECQGKPWQRTLFLTPRSLCVGVGCRRGAQEEQVGAAVREVLSRLGADEEDVEGLYSVSQKAGEPGILAYCRRRRIPYRTFRPEELQAVPGHFAASELVLRTVGTDNVCERAAVKGSGMGLLLAGKTAVGPVTAAAAQRKRGIWF